jgi:hypothetical protein
MLRVASLLLPLLRRYSGRLVPPGSVRCWIA